MEKSCDWINPPTNQNLHILTEQILSSLKYAQELADKDTEDLPTYSQMKKCFEERERIIKEELLNGGYSLELSPGVVELPILEWRSYTTVSDELDEFTRQQIEQSKNEIIKRLVSKNKALDHKLKSLLVSGPSRCGKTALAKLIAYKTKKPYLIVPEIFFTSTCTYQRLEIYFRYARTFKNGAVIIVENIPGKDKLADTSGVYCLRNQIADRDAVHNKNIIVIVTCQDKTNLSEILVSRIQKKERLDFPNANLILAHLTHYLSPEKHISEIFLQKLATNLKQATWQDIQNGILRSKNAEEISEITISESFKEIVTRLKRERGEIEIGDLLKSLYLFNSQFPQ